MSTLSAVKSCTLRQGPMVYAGQGMYVHYQHIVSVEALPYDSFQAEEEFFPKSQLMLSTGQRFISHHSAYEIMRRINAAILETETIRSSSYE